MITESFSAAVARCFGSPEALRCIVFSALKRQSNVHLYLTAQNGDLRLFTTKNAALPNAAVLFHAQGDDEECLQMQWDICDWRACQAKWDQHLSQCPLYPTP